MDIALQRHVIAGCVAASTFVVPVLVVFGAALQCAAWVQAKGGKCIMQRSSETVQSKGDTQQHISNK